jgi:hypothetical protein
MTPILIDHNPVERVWRAISDPAELERWFPATADGHRRRVDGCRLTFTHVFDDRALAAQTAAGWETYLWQLEPHLAGGHLTRVCALELGRYNIRVNSVNPTVVTTPMSAGTGAARTTSKTLSGWRRWTRPWPT